MALGWGPNANSEDVTPSEFFRAAERARGTEADTGPRPRFPMPFFPSFAASLH